MIFQFLEETFYFNKAKDDPSIFYRKYDQKGQNIIFFIILCLFFVGCYFTCSYSTRMPYYVFEQLVFYPLTFAVEEHSTNLSVSFSKLDPKHIFFSMAILLKRVVYIQEYATTNVTINTYIEFFKDYEPVFTESTTTPNILLEFFEKKQRSPLYLFYIIQGINFSDFDANIEICSDNFAGVLSATIYCYTMNANTWNFTTLFRNGAFFATLFFLVGVLLCYTDNYDYPLHKELLILLIMGVFGVNVFQRYATHQFRWFRYSYLMSTVFYTAYRLYMLKFLHLLIGEEIEFNHENTLKWIGYITVILIEIIELFDVITNSSNIFWLNNPNNVKSFADMLIILLNFYYCVYVCFVLFKLFLYNKICKDETRKFIGTVFGTFFSFSIIFNFYVECYFGLFNHLRKTTARFFIENMNTYLVLFAFSYIHNTRCFPMPKFD